MAIDRTTPEGKVFYGLMRRLHERRVGMRGGRRWTRDGTYDSDFRPGLDLLWSYFCGAPPLNSVHQDWQPHIRRYVRMGRLNIAELLINSTGNRMDLWGFMTAAADDEAGDAKAAALMDLSGDTYVRDAHEFMLALGDGYVIITPPDTAVGSARDYPVASAGDPRQVITADDPLTGKPRYGLNMFRDEWDEADLAYVYFPDGVIRRAIHKGSTAITSSPYRPNYKSWEWDDSYGDGGYFHMPEGVFPLVHLENKGGIGEFEHHLDHLDRLNDQIFNGWWTAKIQAFRQRAVKNLPDKDEKGVAIDYTDMFLASPDAMWQVPGDVDFWESTPVDLNPIVNSIQKDLERLAAAVQQPLHTITPDAANGSAEGASLMREEHLFKIGDRITRVKGRHCEVMSALFKLSGDDTRADITQLRAMWGPIERFPLEAKADAASKLAGIMPTEWIWTDVMQVHPSELPRLRSLAGRQQLADAAAARIAATAAGLPGGGGQQGGQQEPPTPRPRALPAPEPAAS